MLGDKKIGIIGGSGIYNLSSARNIKEYKMDTPFGNPSDVIFESLVEGTKCYFLPRHGRNHSLLPTEVNYLANIYALKKLGVKYLISISAVGSLKEEYAPGSFVLPDQFIDWTKGFRKRTFFGNGIVAHVSAAKPVCLKLQEIIAKSCAKCEVDFYRGGSYLCIEGPQFSSKAESNIYRSFGASVIGMTNVPESYLAKEAGMAYSTIAMVTDYDCWKDEHCTIEEILKVMKHNNVNVEKVITDLVPSLGNNKFDFEEENKNAILTPRENLNQEQRAILEVLLS